MILILLMFLGSLGFFLAYKLGVILLINFFYRLMCREYTWSPDPAINRVMASGYYKTTCLSYIKSIVYFWRWETSFLSKNYPLMQFLMSEYQKLNKHE